MNPNPWWNLTRASAIVAWVLMAVAILWGVLLATRVLKPNDRPAWLLDLHRWLGVLSIATVAAHLGALVADSNPYVYFGWRELFVPQASAWRPVAVTWGVIAFYILVVVQLTSLVMKKLPKRVWRSIHLTSYAMFVMATVHGFLAGADAKHLVFIVVASAGCGVLLFATVARVLQARAKRIPAST